MAQGGGAEYIPPGPSVRPGVGPQRGQPASTPGRPGQGNRGRGPGKGPPKGPPNRGPSKPPTRPAAAAQALGAPRAKTPFYGGEIPNIGGLASRLQLQQVGAPLHAAEEGEKASVRLPFAQKNSEIVNTEGNVRNKLGEINAGNNTYLQGLIAGAEGSAKTANNYAAENALSAQKNVETAGQNALTNVGGQFAGNVAATEQRGQANIQAIRTMALAAAAQGQQGLQTAQSRFATEASRNRAAENQALEKVTARGKNARLEAGQKLYSDLLGLKTLEQRGALGSAKLAQGAEGLNIKRGQLGVNKFNAQTKATQGAQKLALDAGKLNLDMQLGGSRMQHERADEQYKNAGLNDKLAVDSANIKFKEGELRSKWEANWIKQHPAQAGVKPSATGVAKFLTEWGVGQNALEALSSEASSKHRNFTDYTSWRRNLAKGQREVEVGGKPKLVKVQAVTNPLILKAIEEAWTKHYVSPQTKAALNQVGLPSEGLSNLLRRG